MLSYTDLFWHFLRAVEATLAHPFAVLSQEEQAAIIQNVDQAVETVLSLAHPEGEGGGGGPGGGGQGGDGQGFGLAGRIFHTTRGDSSFMPRPFVNLGEQTEPESVLPSESGCTGCVRPYQGGVAMYVFPDSANTFVFNPAEHMFPAQILVKTDFDNSLIPGVPSYTLEWQDIETVSIAPGECVILRPRPQPQQ